MLRGTQERYLCYYHWYQASRHTICLLSGPNALVVACRTFFRSYTVSQVADLVQTLVVLAMIP